MMYKHIKCIFNLISLLTLLCVFVSSAESESNTLKMTNNKRESDKNQTVYYNAASPDLLNVEKNNELVVLLHGFNRTNRDMSTLEVFFRSRGYHVITPELPILFQSLEDCTKKFEHYFYTIQGSYDNIHLVGHSFGGLIIRQFLSRNKVPNPGRCVLIATPSKGTELAAIVASYLKPIALVFKPYQSL